MQYTPESDETLKKFTFVRYLFFYIRLLTDKIS
jgi:hypothetical protein